MTADTPPVVSRGADMLDAPRGALRGPPVLALGNRIPLRRGRPAARACRRELGSAECFSRIAEHLTHVRPGQIQAPLEQAGERYPVRVGRIVGGACHTRPPCPQVVEVECGKLAEARQIVTIPVAPERLRRAERESGLFLKLAPRATLEILAGFQESSGQVERAAPRLVATGQYEQAPVAVHDESDARPGVVVDAVPAARAGDLQPIRFAPPAWSPAHRAAAHGTRDRRRGD